MIYVGIRAGSRVTEIVIICERAANPSPHICINPFHGDEFGEHYSADSDPIDGWSAYVRNAGDNMASDRDFPTREAALAYIEVLKRRYHLTDDDVREF